MLEDEEKKGVLINSQTSDPSNWMKGRWCHPLRQKLQKKEMLETSDNFSFGNAEFKVPLKHSTEDPIGNWTEICVRDTDLRVTTCD